MLKPFDSLRTGHLESHTEETEARAPIYLEYLHKNFTIEVHRCGGERCIRRGVMFSRRPTSPEGPPLHQVTGFIFSTQFGAGRNKMTTEARHWLDEKTKAHWTKKDAVDFRFDEAKRIVEPTLGLTLVCDWPAGLRATVYEGLKNICGTTKVATMIFHALNPDAVPIIDRAQIWKQFKDDFGWSTTDGITGDQFDEFCNQAGDSFYEAIGKPSGADLILANQSSLKAWSVEDVIGAIRLPLNPNWAKHNFETRHTLGKLADNVLRAERPVLA